MEQHSDWNTILQLLPQPAFRVENGVISQVNLAAAAYLIEAGQPFAPMILSGQQEYAEFTGGTLYLTLSLADQVLGACVSCMENGHIVTLEQASEMPQLQAMALAAKELREPLNGMLSLAEQMLPAVAKEGSTLETQASQMNRRLYQMLRIVSNMSDAISYSQAQTGQTESMELCALVEEILDKACAYAQNIGIMLTYELPPVPIFTQGDREKLERAIYNLLSNAIKFATPGTPVQVKLTVKNKRAYLSVSNSHGGSPLQGNIYNRFLRQLSLEDPRNGVGLGMVLVRSTATLHGGAVLLEQTEDDIRITMTLQIKSKPSDQVRSPIMRFDYAGERDHCLLELADVLPAQLYSPDQIK